MPNSKINFLEKELRDRISKALPKLKEACEVEADVVILHQDAFAADYQVEEYLLLGMAVKFIGLHNKEIRIIGGNRETLDPNNRQEGDIARNIMVARQIKKAHENSGEIDVKTDHVEP